MAGATGRVIGAAVSLYNENSLSLANLNFNFALIKVEAPKEFQELGMTISPKRKEDAESGTLHQTARKLGALFEKIVPNTPALYRAYGTRVSEISKDPAVNPQKKEGIFAQQIGVDSASIWAAATSGSGAIAVHLLGCMLARMFTGPEATSIWVELVAQRKDQIQKMRNEAIYADEHSTAFSAARQEISRTDLGRWDNSARAWLQSGDQTKILQHKQLMLILENLKLPVNEDQDVFDSVMKAWCSALKAMDSLVQGKAQRVQDGAVLLGMSSWHLYPDMTVLGDNVITINQKDGLFQDTAILTIGLQFSEASEESISWSLPLACLQYYGHPVRAKRSVGQENARISMGQFEYVILGCLFAKWEDYGKTLEDGLFWLQKLDALLLEPTQLALAGRTNRDSTRNCLWMAKICAIGSRLSKIIAVDDVDSRLEKRLVELGRRRWEFIFPCSMLSTPLFGLSDISVLFQMTNNCEQRVQLLREFSSYHALSNSDYVIRYWTLKKTDRSWPDRFKFEYATVQPLHVDVSTKTTHDEGTGNSNRHSSSHVRWLPVSAADLLRLGSCNCTHISDDSVRSKHCKDRPKAFRCIADDCSDVKPLNGKGSISHCTNIHHCMLWNRYLQIRCLGELCLPIIENCWNLSTQLISNGGFDFGETLDLLLSIVRQQELGSFGGAPAIFGIPKCAEIYRIGGKTKPSVPSKVIEPQVMVEMLKDTVLDAQKVFSYLYQQMDSISDRRALWAFVAASEIYSYLPYATISTSILLTKLSAARWIPPSSRLNVKSNKNQLSLAEVFACVAMFDSGTVNVDPASLSEVFAMSSGNSIYVTSVLVEDPAETPNVADIRRIVGNIGQSGISFLVPPPEPKTRGVEMDNWMQINHRKFDGNAENNFQHTTIHLSFTNYEMPLKTQYEDRHTIDQPARLVETLLAVHDRGAWIADLNFLHALACHPISKAERKRLNAINDSKPADEHRKLMSSNIKRLQCYHGCSPETSHRTFHETLEKMTDSFGNNDRLPLTSIDNWDELLDPPQDEILVLRAHKNWLARLALAGVCRNKEIVVIVLPEEPCWTCCLALLLNRYNPKVSNITVSKQKRIAVLY